VSVSHRVVAYLKHPSSAIEYRPLP